MCKEPYRVFDPAITSGDGRGTISANGTYVSLATEMKRWKEISWLVVVTGTLQGTFTVEITNGTDEEIRLGTATWVPYTPVSITWASGAASFGVTCRPRFARVRLKLVVTGGTGTVTAQDSAR